MVPALEVENRNKEVRILFGDLSGQRLRSGQKIALIDGRWQFVKDIVAGCKYVLQLFFRKARGKQTLIAIEVLGWDRISHRVRKIGRRVFLDKDGTYMWRQENSADEPRCYLSYAGA